MLNQTIFEKIRANQHEQAIAALKQIALLESGPRSRAIMETDFQGYDYLRTALLVESKPVVLFLLNTFDWQKELNLDTAVSLNARLNNLERNFFNECLQHYVLRKARTCLQNFNEYLHQNYSQPTLGKFMLFCLISLISGFFWTISAAFAFYGELDHFSVPTTGNNDLDTSLLLVAWIAAQLMITFLFRNSISMGWASVSSRHLEQRDRVDLNYIIRELRKINIAPTEQSNNFQNLVNRLEILLADPHTRLSNLYVILKEIKDFIGGLDPHLISIIEVPNNSAALVTTSSNYAGFFRNFTKYAFTRNIDLESESNAMPLSYSHSA